MLGIRLCAWVEVKGTGEEGVWKRARDVHVGDEVNVLYGRVSQWVPILEVVEVIGKAGDVFFGGIGDQHPVWVGELVGFVLPRVKPHTPRGELATDETLRLFRLPPDVRLPFVRVKANEEDALCVFAATLMTEQQKKRDMCFFGKSSLEDRCREWCQYVLN